MVSSSKKGAIRPPLGSSFISTDKLLFVKELKRPSSSEEWIFNLQDFTTEKSKEVDKNYISTFNITVPSQPSFQFENNKKGGTPVTTIGLFPYIKKNGVILRISSITLQKKITPTYHSKSTSFATSSVLKQGSGQWFKLAVQKDGIYKIDYAYLKDIGVNVHNLSSDAINIYGNSFGKLPELNSIYRPDDLLKDNILVKDGGDGTFDPGDYILFYGRSPHRWVQSNDPSHPFHRVRNIYSTYSAYFLNINTSGTPARIQPASTTTNSPTTVVTTYDSYTIHEKDERNLLHSGQRWYGELFDAHLSQNFSFNIPQLVPHSTSSIRFFGAAKYGSSNTTYFTVKYNNKILGKSYLHSAGDFSRSRSGFVSAANIFSPQSSQITLNVTFQRSVPADQGYLDFIEINTRSYLHFFQEMEFRDLQSVGSGNIAEFKISNFPTNGVVWEITNPTQPKLVSGTKNGSTFSFKIASDSLRQFIAFNGSNFKSPQFIGRVKHQNLHGLGAAQLLIVTHPKFLPQANRLAQIHQNEGLSVHVVTTTQVYNEFSGGTPDPTAIKFFAKMFYQRYQGSPTKALQNLLLFGKGTYDPLNRIPDNQYFVPVYETVNSEGHTSSLVSDDYFGLLDDNESFATLDNLDIGVGRLPATTSEEANIFINKIVQYMKKGYAKTILSSQKDKDCCDQQAATGDFGDWRLHYTLIGDDEEGGWFINKDLEPIAKYVDTNHPMMNAKKIYTDAYNQVTTAGGERYPSVNEDIIRSINQGALVTCYVGHGGAQGIGQERILTIEEVQALKNSALTLFVSATCDFYPMDQIGGTSIGKEMILNENGGAIAEMTTSRAVYFTVNDSISNHFFYNVFARQSDKSPSTFGEIFMKTKNDVVGGSNNKRSFILIGDPALKINLPYQKVVMDSLNKVSVNVIEDTIKALSKVRITGHLEDQFGNTLTHFDGVVQPTIYDKPQLNQTKGQDPTSPIIDFKTQTNILFKGKSTVKNGFFDFEFIVPKDINYSYGKGKASFYGISTTSTNAGGSSNRFYIGGIDTSSTNDNKGPDIQLYLNDLNFANGGMTNETPILISKLYDDNGINTVGNGIGHNITMVLDKNTSDAVVLNDYYESDLDTYKSGKIHYQLDKLSEGRHTLTLTAWDVYNNSNEKTIEFVVHKKEDIALDHVLNYPNPFTTHTKFYFEHNQVCSALKTQIQIYTVTGRLVKTINKMVKTRGFLIEGIPWDGRDDFGDQLARGVYIYRITITNADGDKAKKIQKLYLLK